MKMIKLFGVPLYQGANKHGIKDSINMLIKHNNKYSSNINIINPIVDSEKEEGKLKHLEGVSKTCEILARDINRAVKQDYLPITIGGDHALAIGTIAGISKEKKLGVLWIDAHADMNNHISTNSGNIHGMPLATSLGIGNEKLVNCFYNEPKLKSEDVTIFGTRAVEKLEQEEIDRLDINHYPWEDIKRKGFFKCVDEIIEKYRMYDNLHISFDLDSIDPSEITGVSTPVKGGLTKKEVKYLFLALLKLKNISSVDIVEYNPHLEKSDETVIFIDELVELISRSLNW